MALIFFILLQLSKWNEASFDLIMEVIREAENTHRMRDALHKRETSIQRMLNAETSPERQQEYQHFLQYADEYNDALDKIQQLDSRQDISSRYRKLEQSITEIRPYQQRLVEEIMQGKLPHRELHALALDESRAQEHVVNLLDRLVDLQRDRYMNVVTDYKQRRDTVLLMTAAIFAIGVAVSVLVMRFSGSRFRYVSRLTVMDDVTGTYNRRYFDMVVEEEWKRSMREYTPISLLMIDIDFFKEYNDTHGHQLGDVCLFSVAKILAGQLKRATDFIARYGGEEFAIVLPNTNAEHARLLAERMRRAVEEARIKAGKDDVSPWLTISVGLATTTAEYDQPNMVLVRAADNCLYQSKAAGRNRVTDINLATVDD